MGRELDLRDRVGGDSSRGDLAGRRCRRPQAEVG